MKQIRAIILAAGLITLCSCSSGNAGNNSIEVTASDEKSSETNEQPKAGTVRYANNTLQYLNADGNWVTLITGSQLEKTASVS